MKQTKKYCCKYHECKCIFSNILGILVQKVFSDGKIHEGFILLLKN